MALPAKNPTSKVFTQVTFPQEIPHLPEAFLRSNPDLRNYDKELTEWWFVVRTNLRRLQENLSSSGSLAETGVTPGTYGPAS